MGVPWFHPCVCVHAGSASRLYVGQPQSGSIIRGMAALYILSKPQESEVCPFVPSLACCVCVLHSFSYDVYPLTHCMDSLVPAWLAASVVVRLP